MDKNQKKQVAKISVFITSIFVIFLSVTYAFINMNVTGTKRQVITSGNLQIELEEDNVITLTNAMPMYDEVGMIQDAFNFRLVNKTSEDTNYIVKLVDITNASKDKLDTSIVKYGLTKDGVSTVNLLSTLKDNQIDSGKISGNQAINYSLRLWIHSTVTNNDSIKDKMLSYRIDVEYGQDEEFNKNKGVMMARGTMLQWITGEQVEMPSNDRFYAYSADITSIIFENTVNVPFNIAADKKWDVSVEQDESVMAYLEEIGTLESENTTYKLHIQAENEIYANPNSYALFGDLYNVRSIEGLEYLNTSKVTSMFGMFAGCSSLTSLDVGYLDTSNVTNMSDMFGRCKNLISLDLSNFNTSNVTDMSGMFYECNSLSSLDLSYFNTANVTDMSVMFSNCGGLTSLDLSSFNTSKVIGMSSMFASFPSTCLITVRDDAMVSWVKGINSSLTNVVVKSA